MKYLVIISAIFLLPLSVSSQYSYYNDAIQSQVYDNPATIGSNASTQIRASYNNVGYNRLGRNSYKQADIYFDRGKELKSKDVWAFGIGTHLDRAGAGDFGHTTLTLASAYHKRLGAKKQFLTVGTSLSAIRRSFDDDDLLWPSQIVHHIDLDPIILEGPNTSTNFLGLDIGLMYSMFSSKNQYLKLGVTLQNVTDPNVSLYDTAVAKEGSRVLLSALGQLRIHGAFHIEPSFRYISLGQQSITALTNNFMLRLNDNKSIVLGVGYRNNNNYSLNAGVEIHGYRVMLIYGWAQNTPLDHKMVELSIGHRFR